MTWTLEPPAKVNLFLRVLARETSGYHQLETLFQAVDLTDTLELELRGRGVRLDVQGADVGPVEDNLVVRAARLFLERTGRGEGVRFRLRKGIPAGGGLGGGSSDAAAALRLLNHALGSPLPADELVRMGGELGADVPFFLCGSPTALAWGRGDRLLALPALPRRWLVLALPPERSETVRAYRELASRRGEADWAGARSRAVRELASWEVLAREAENAFHDPVFALHARLRTLRDRLAALGGRPALLAGSGSVVFGVFDTRQGAREAGEALEREWTDVQVRIAATLTEVPSVRGSDGAGG